jgi:soluble cytochrome b562
MSTTSDLPKWLRMVADSDAASSYTNRAEHMRAAAARLDELERENARMRAALEDIAKQVPAKDMDEDYYEAADFEDGYDRCVFQARAALAGSGEK